MKRKDARGKAKDRRIVLLADLAPRKDVKGGAAKLLFGEQPEPRPAADERRTTSAAAAKPRS